MRVILKVPCFSTIPSSNSRSFDRIWRWPRAGGSQKYNTWFNPAPVHSLASVDHRPYSLSYIKALFLTSHYTRSTVVRELQLPSNTTDH